MKITESQLRRVIRQVIKESQGEDISSLTAPGDEDYLSSMGISDLEDAISHAMNESRSLANNSINRLMFRVIKESASDDQKMMNAANLINNSIKDDSPENLELAAQKLEELKREKNARKRLKIVAAALSILGASALLAPMVLLFIAGIGSVHVGIGASALAILNKMGAIGTIILMSIGGTTAAAGIDREQNPSKYI